MNDGVLHMMQKIFRRLKEENANSMVENVIILPLIFIVIYFMILMSFVMHDRATLDSAAKRGTIFAAKCISDPNYANILRKSGHSSGDLDTSVATFGDQSFKGVGDNIQPFRYLCMNPATIINDTETEILNMIKKTKIPWREIKAENVVVDVKNSIIYQTVSVSIKATYPMPAVFSAFGLPTEFEYEVNATTAVNDPDEFIRNVDLVVDIFVELDKKLLGGNVANVVSKIGQMGTKLKDFLAVD